MIDPAERDRRIARFHALDQETWKIEPGIPAPRIVCLSHTSRREPPGIAIGPEIAVTARRLLESDEIIVGANLAFDFACLAQADASLLSLIFRAYEEGRVHDVLICQALDAIAGGHLGFDPRTASKLKNAKGKDTGRYNLYNVTSLVLGRDDAKSNDAYQTSYRILDVVPSNGRAEDYPLGCLPVTEWADEAREYVLDDVKNPLEIAERQILGWTRGGVDDYDGPARNLQDLASQCEAAFALHLGACWSLRTDRDRLAELTTVVEEKHRVAVERFQKKGWIRPDGTEDQAAVKRAVVVAYGGDGDCLRCRGMGRVGKWEKIECRGEKLRGRYQSCAGASCQMCSGVGSVVRETGSLTCKVQQAEADEIARSGLPDGAVAEGEFWGCDGTGIDLSTAPLLPRTDKSGVSTSRDTVMECIDDDLIDYGSNEFEKSRSTYLPYLRTGIDRPLSYGTNVLVATGRVSLEKTPLHQMPRHGGERECVVPRDGYYLGSTDYEAGELCTLAQYIFWLFGESRMRDVINETGKPGILHSDLAAEVLGISLDDFLVRLKAKDKIAVDYRQAMKPVNFGSPGGMGVVKFVLTNRKKSTGFTLCQSGPSVNEKGQVGYWGIRFCILVGGAEQCGEEKTTKWGRQFCAPVCKACLRVVDKKLRPAYFKRYPEVKEYFKWAQQVIDQAVGEGKPLLAPSAVWNQRTGQNKVIRERRLDYGDYSAFLNNGFQSMLSDIGKLAFRRMVREGYTGRRWDNGEPSPLAGARLPLYLHDEPLSELPITTAHLAGPRIAEIMMEAGRELAPDVVWRAETAIAKRWSKAMEPVYVGGKLVPWEPEAT